MIYLCVIFVIKLISTYFITHTQFFSVHMLSDIYHVYQNPLTCVELEALNKNSLSEPHLGVGVEQALVVVVSDTTSVLHLANHVADCVP